MQCLQNDPQSPCLVSGTAEFLCFCSFTHRIRVVIHTRCLLSSDELPIGDPGTEVSSWGRGVVAVTALLGTNCMLVTKLFHGDGEFLI